RPAGRARRRRARKPGTMPQPGGGRPLHSRFTTAGPARPLDRCDPRKLLMQTEKPMAEFKNIVLNARLDGYIRAHAEPRLPAQAELEAKTTALGEVAEMQIPHEQGVLLTMLVRILQARTVVEIGTFTGYAALAMALGLPEGGKVITLDRSTEWLEIATQAWQDAGVERS